MGLDITAYKKVALVKAMSIRDYYDGDAPAGHRFIYPEESFAAAADGLVSGIYRVSDEQHAFRAGSYGGYNAWRAQLAQLVGTTDKAIWADPKPGPFVELINFSDAEGVIGPQTSAKLARDFAEWRKRAREFDTTDGWFFDRYEGWLKAFELAAGEGAVEFH